MLAVGVVLRRLLRLDGQPVARGRGLVPLSANREAIYEPIALEVETQAAILAISLNEAIEERQANHDKIAWRLILLSASEWDRLAEIVTLLLNAVARYLPVACGVAPPRALVAHRFKSPVMIDYARLHQLLDQLVFRSRLRYQVHVRVLRRAAETLTTEYRRAHWEAEPTRTTPPQLWNRLDFYVHDLDLVAKEALLAFRAFLACLPEPALAEFAAYLDPIIRHAVRTTLVRGPDEVLKRS